mmetsp:Transcript_13879/g.31512  ORF Transcript_13879/g.31512 Transcript_13879/m.31512 type:complete len:404 (-) Transcript_13879:45-1256(-)
MGCDESKAVKTEEYPCQRCNKLSTNGPPNQYCSVECKDGLTRGESSASDGKDGLTRREISASDGQDGLAKRESSASDGGGGGPICQKPGCGKPTFDGQPGYCSFTCRDVSTKGASTKDGPPTCGRHDCFKPTWDGKPGSFCSKTCRAMVSDGKSHCLIPDCERPTWNGKPNEYCSKACREKGRTSRPTMFKQMKPGDSRYEGIKKQYEAKWDHNRGSPTPLKAVYEVRPSSKMCTDFEGTLAKIGSCATFGSGTNPGNVQRRFHGTRLKCKFAETGVCCSDTECSACRIVSDGFDMGKLGSWSGNKGHYGGGLYFTSMSSTAKGYGMRDGFSWSKGNWNDPRAGNCILVVKVACGRVETVDDKTHQPIDLSKHDSRKVDKDTGVDELVVFNAKQTQVRYMLTF